MKLYFRELGEGFPLVILHGLFGMSDNWMSIGKKLSDNYRVIIPDLRNHGSSPHDRAWDYNVMTRDLDELIQSLNIDRFHLMGHSMGGKVAMNYVRVFGDKVQKLIVIDIAPRYYPVHHQKILEALLSVDLENIQTRKEAEEQLERHIDNWGIRQFLLKNLKRDDEGFKWKFNLNIINEQIENVGAEISGFVAEVPTLFVAGSGSDYINQQDKTEIRELFTNSLIISIKGAGHWIHADKPDEFLESVTRFLEN